ncbi:kunitz trypsin inhibitor 5-like [Solanum verrucosum]|uniref:kunitz trypsin inhibitor 5-like n=1 Tax=Solanum verrucosum TaxID=315347 RepID=UPI0020D1316E|nr:kunitz trypsin inhibitor 5-like [Solanum verrucosum]
MKSVVLLISFLLAFWCSCTSASPNPVLQVVRDINGEILRSDTRYFIVSVIRGAGGGGVLRGPVINGDANFVCPSQVVQSKLDSNRGMSVYFKPKAPEQVEIIESSDVNIEFYLDNPTICKNNVWEVEDFPGQDKPMYLSTNGEAGNTMNVASWFQIKEVDGFTYKLVFCPYGEHICTDIGIDHAYGQRRLAIRTDNTFHVVFIKDPFIGIKSII